MSQLSRRSVWIASAVSLLAIGALAVVLLLAGLDRADKLGSVISALVGLVALVATVLWLRTPGPGGRTEVRGGPEITITQNNEAGGNTQNNYVQPPP